MTMNVFNLCLSLLYKLLTGNRPITTTTTTAITTTTTTHNIVYHISMNKVN
jgi:hypothetical protein